MMLGIVAGAAVDAGGGGGEEGEIIITAGSSSARRGFDDPALDNFGTLDFNGTGYDILGVEYNGSGQFYFTFSLAGGGDPAPSGTLPFTRLEWVDNASNSVQVTGASDPSSITRGGGRQFQWPAPAGIVGFTNGIQYTITLVP